MLYKITIKTFIFNSKTNPNILLITKYRKIILWNATIALECNSSMME